MYASADLPRLLLFSRDCKFMGNGVRLARDFVTGIRDRRVAAHGADKAMSRAASLIHGSGVSARTGGFGCVFGSKNLKAISWTGWYIKCLYELGVLRPGKQMESHPLPMDQWGKLTFRGIFRNAIARKAGIGVKA